MSKLFNIFLILTLSACSWLGTNQVGDVPEDIRVKAVKVGKHPGGIVKTTYKQPYNLGKYENCSHHGLDQRP